MSVGGTLWLQRLSEINVINVPRCEGETATGFPWRTLLIAPWSYNLSREALRHHFPGSQAKKKMGNGGALWSRGAEEQFNRANDSRSSQNHGTRQTSAFCVLFCLLPPTQEEKNWLGALPPATASVNLPSPGSLGGMNVQNVFSSFCVFTSRKDRPVRCPSGAVEHIFWSPLNDAAFGGTNLNLQVISTDRSSELRFLEFFLGPPA